MALPLAIPLIMGGISAAQTLMGGLQANKARNAYENAVAPSLLDSKAYKTAQTTENLTGRWAQTGLPEQTMRFQGDMIGRSGAASLASAQGLRQGTMGLGATAQSLGDQYRSLAAMDANQRIANRTQYLGARQNVQNIEMEQGQRDYGQFLNQQAMRLAQMSAGRDSMSQGMQGMTNAMGLGYQMSLTPTEFGGTMYGGRGQTPMQPMQSLGAGPIETNSFTPQFIPPQFIPPQMQSAPISGMTPNNIRFGNMSQAANIAGNAFNPFGFMFGNQ